ncbi:winged helix-turn-helix transcriptional regulator [Streptomyces sp. NBC_01351]|uniref:winged helix-turn-helix transcriptional regulator n=1 Tax=Streptomyces sp. NBC_01351 TaxID=2903833 RepID=UPI002E357264|nr:winged helix-turn-helix transcriptional regulator [Streptomyces sp. NBC_01351]
MRRGIEYCPVTAGVEAVGDRWTLLVLRELLLGSERFNDIHRGLPGISRSLLSARLRRMRAHGLVLRALDADGRPAYRLTPAGAALEPLVWQLGDWARRWSFGDPMREQLDGGWVLWRLRQFVRAEALPRARVVVEFALRLEGVPDEHVWLVLAPGGDVSACRVHPGYEVGVWVSADLAELHRMVAGTATLEAARRSGRVRIDGDPELVAAFPSWFAWRTPARELAPPGP